MRGAWRQDREVLIENVCSSGLDLLVRPTGKDAWGITRLRIRCSNAAELADAPEPAHS